MPLLQQASCWITINSGRNPFARFIAGVVGMAPTYRTTTTTIVNKTTRTTSTSNLSSSLWWWLTKRRGSSLVVLFVYCSYYYYCPVLTPVQSWSTMVYTKLGGAVRTTRTATTLSSLASTRNRFLSSSASAFLAICTVPLLVVGVDPEQQHGEYSSLSCWAATSSTNMHNSFLEATSGISNNNPRYIDREVQMQYGGEGPGGGGTGGQPRYRGLLVRRFTGDSTPYQFPVKAIKLSKQWPREPPFRPEDFSRTDPTNDGAFYTVPRLVYHIDEPAVAALTQYYRKSITPGSTILDICSSWVSHYPLEFPRTMKGIYGTGMNGIELQYNDQLTKGYTVTDLNVKPKLPYADAMFDVVTCVVSIDYLIHPMEVLQEVHRVLKPGGKVIISQSNRCFPTKAIAMWLPMSDRQHLELINGYLQYASGFVSSRQVWDITATVPNNAYHDPMFIVEAIKE